MVMGIVLRKRCVAKKKNYHITSGRRDVDPHGWLRAAQGRLGEFRDFSTIPNNVKFKTREI